MGQDEWYAGNTAGGRKLFADTYRTTTALLAASPNDAERIFGHAQSEFWVGFANYRDKRYTAAKASWQRYKSLAGRLRAINPRDPRGLKELGYAEGNLCTLALTPPADIRAALRSCGAALVLVKRAAQGSDDPDLIGDLSNRYGWLADAYRAAGNVDRAWSNRRTQEDLLKRLMTRDPKNMDIQDRWLTNQFMMAELEIDRSDTAPARQRLMQAQALARQMTRLDPANGEWRRWSVRIQNDLARTQAGKAKSNGTPS
jgi:hypothetical protein